MKNKFNSKKTTVDGIVFDSKRESEYYLIYKSMLQHGEIKSLERQPRYEIIPKFGKERAAYYTPDFRLTYPDGRVVVVEVKGKATRDYILRRKLFKRQNPDVEFMEVH
jgi:predicted nuclease of restriction endonuclease-like RecB superfamily